MLTEPSVCKKEVAVALEENDLGPEERRKGSSPRGCSQRALGLERRV